MLDRWPCEGTSNTQIGSFTSSERLASKAIGDCPKINPLNQSTPLSDASANLSSQTLLKRSRSKELSDGEDDTMQRKKRRLRLEFVTSRLSQPYAEPATHIIGTRTWRAGTWSRQRFVGGKLLRKAAIFNCIARKRKAHSSVDINIGERKTGNAPATPHPKMFERGLSQRASAGLGAAPAPCDYDIFDYEEDPIFDDEEADEEDTESSDEDSQVIHSDFHSLESSETDPEYFDTSWSFVGTGDPEFDPSGTELELVMENERKDEISIAPPRLEVLPSLSASLQVAST